MLQKAAVEQKLLNLITRLQKDAALKNFFLVGGTALALHIGHRKSIDIDLFTEEAFDENTMLEYLERSYDFRMNYKAQSTLKGSIEDIRVDLIAHQYPSLRELLEIEGIRLASVEDISAMKVNAIAGDGTRVKDFIDLYFLLKQFSIGVIVDFFSAKYSARNNAHTIKSLTWFEDVDLNDWPVMIREPELTFKKVKSSIIKHRNIFLSKEGIG